VLVGLAEVEAGGGDGAGSGGDGAGGGAKLSVVSDGGDGGAGGVGTAGGGTDGDVDGDDGRGCGGRGCEYAESITVAVTATVTSGNPTSRAGRRKRHAGLPVMPPY